MPYSVFFKSYLFNFALYCRQFILLLYGVTFIEKKTIVSIIEYSLDFQ